MDAATIAKLLQLGANLVVLIEEIRQQTEANSETVWKDVTENYSASVEAWNAATLKS